MKKNKYEIRKNKYDIGNIFRIELYDKKTYVYGRILLRDEDLLFVKIFAKTTKKGEEINLQEIINSEKIIVSWVTNNGIRLKIWDIVGNIEKKDFKMPNLYRKDLLREGVYTLIINGIKFGEGIEKRVGESEIKGAYEECVYDFEAVRIKVVHELEKRGMYKKI